MYDLIVIGAGPVGLAAGIEAGRKGMSVLLLEKGTLIQTIVAWPKETIFFSEARNIEIGGHPFPSLTPKPTRREALAYYRRVAEVEGLDIRTYCRATAIGGQIGRFKVTYQDRSGTGLLESRLVLLASGYHANPNRLGVPGEGLPHVHYGIDETIPYWNQRVAIIGGSNSAIETALDLYRGGAKVTVVHRDPEVRPSLKYWLKPDFENRVKEGTIKLMLNVVVREIKRREVVVERGEPSATSHQSAANGQQLTAIPADFVVVLIGYRAVDQLLRDAGVKFDANDDQPLLSGAYETSVAGLFVAGSAGYGSDTRTVFIENGRDHARVAVGEMEQRLKGVEARVEG
jgi:thioredoxin reductase (NADPH)